MDQYERAGTLRGRILKNKIEALHGFWSLRLIPPSNLIVPAVLNALLS
jgi:hypothetical protein